MKSVSLALTAALMAGAVAAPTFASAQDYGYGRAPAATYGRPYADPCQQARSNQTAGAVVGAIAGAVLGSNVASRGARSEGGAVGALAGALVGSQMAKGSSASYACYGPNDRPGYAYGGAPRPYGYDRGYQRPYGYDRGYRGDERSYDRDAGYGRDRDYDRDDDRDAAQPRRADTDGCRLAESAIRMPDGRSEQRWVRVCPDQNGNYRVVD